MSDNSDRMRIVIWYAAWATICAAAACIVISLLHTWFFAYTPTRAARMGTLIEGIETALALAAGQPFQGHRRRPRSRRRFRGPAAHRAR